MDLLHFENGEAGARGAIGAAALLLLHGGCSCDAHCAAAAAAGCGSTRWAPAPSSPARPPPPGSGRISAVRSMSPSGSARPSAGLALPETCTPGSRGTEQAQGSYQD